MIEAHVLAEGVIAVTTNVYTVPANTRVRLSGAAIFVVTGVGVVQFSAARTGPRRLASGNIAAGAFLPVTLPHVLEAGDILQISLAAAVTSVTYWLSGTTYEP